MQVVDHKNIEKRILFYCAKLFTSSLKSGYDYAALEKSISILITNYELEKHKDIQKYITKWNLREETYPMHNYDKPAPTENPPPLCYKRLTNQSFPYRYTM